MRTAGSLLLCVIALAANAQNAAPDTNAPAAAPQADIRTNLPTDRARTEITSDSWNYDHKSQIAVWLGHVVVKDPQMTLTCGIMTAKLPESGGRIESIVAEQDVVIDGKDNQGRPVHATGQKAVYTFFSSPTITNETVVLSGDPYVKSVNFEGRGKTLTWDRIHDLISATETRMFIQEENKNKTNSSSASPFDFNPKK